MKRFAVIPRGSYRRRDERLRRVRMRGGPVAVHFEHRRRHRARRDVLIGIEKSKGDALIGGRVLQRRHHQGQIDRSGCKRGRLLRERQKFHLNVGQRHPGTLQRFEQFVGQVRPGLIDRDDLAFEIGRRLEQAA